jgi:ribosomal 50S subunit-recycling heat shock protein
LLNIDVDEAGQRLDNYLMRQLKGVPKTHVYRIIRSGEVRINKGRVSADTRLKAGDVVRLPPVRVSERSIDKSLAMAELASGQASIHAPARDFAVLYEDEQLLAINKPAGVAVHGGSGVSFGVIEQLRMARPQTQFLELIIDWTARPVESCWSPKNAVRSRTCRTSFVSVKPGKPIWQWCRANGLRTKRCWTSLCTNICCRMASGASRWLPGRTRTACHP